MPPSSQWYYRLFGEEFGPVSLDQLRETFHCGTIGLDDDVRRDGVTGWRPLRQVPELTGSVSPAVTNITTTSATEQWYCKVLGSELGPIAFDELLGFARDQQLTANDEVKLGENGKWRRAGSIGRLMSVMPYQNVTPVPVTSAPTTPVTPALPSTATPAARPAVSVQPTPASAPGATTQVVSQPATTIQPASASPANVREAAPAAIKPSPPPSVIQVPDTPKPNDIPIHTPPVTPTRAPEVPTSISSAPVMHAPVVKSYSSSVSQNSLGDRLSQLKDDFLESKTLPQLAAVIVGLLFVYGGWQYLMSGRTGPQLYAVTGVVTFDNKPLPQASVIFNPADEKSGKLATGRTDDKGYFQLYTDSDSGVLPAQYQVMIIAEEKLTTPSERNVGTATKPGESPSFAALPKSLIPDKYTNPATSGLVYPVDEKTQHFEIKLAKEEGK